MVIIVIGRRKLPVPLKHRKFHLLSLIVRLPAKPSPHDLVDERAERHLCRVTRKRNVDVLADSAIRLGRLRRKAAERSRRIRLQENVGGLGPVVLQDVDGAHDDEAGNDGVCSGNGRNNVPSHLLDFESRLCRNAVGNRTKVGSSEDKVKRVIVVLVECEGNLGMRDGTCRYAVAAGGLSERLRTSDLVAHLSMNSSRLSLTLSFR